MAGDPLIKPIAGQRFKSSARAFSAFLDTAVDRQTRGPGGGRGQVFDETLPPHVLLQNKSGADREHGAILGLGAVAIAPTAADPVPVYSAPIFRGVSPLRIFHGGRYAILLEPIDNDHIGRAVIRGTWWGKLNLLRAWHEFCDPRDGDYAQLTSGDFGSTRILDYDSTTHWAVVAIGNPDHRFYSRITGSTAETTRFTYDWEEVELTGAGYANWTTIAGGRAGSAARNTFEVPDGQKNAVASGVVVEMHEILPTTVEGSARYWFTLAMSVQLVDRAMVVEARWYNDEYQVLLKTYKVVDESISPPQEGTWVKWLDTTHCEPTA